jgi:hypothetical protein
MSKLTTQKTKELLWESVKEPARLLLIGLVSFTIIYLTGTEQQTELTAMLIVLLRFLDKVLHEVGKDQNNALVTGLTRF